MMTNVLLSYDQLNIQTEMTLPVRLAQDIKEEFVIVYNQSKGYLDDCEDIIWHLTQWNFIY